MLELFASLYSFRSIAGNLHFVDIFDVLIIAFFLYIVIILFKRTRSWPILVGIGILAIVYTFAQTFNLFLTSLVLQSFFAVFIVVLVIIFQQEVRRFFEYISFWNTRQFKIKQETSIFPFDINEVLQAVAQFVKEKRGALIVFPGNENIERFLEGGEQIDGLITEELLVSIFDPHSLGHDGAVIIKKNRIAQFGVHLPLSTNFKQLGRKRGTRHSAALGITEYADALVIAVSEERGTVSVAHHGRLKELKTIEELEASLKKFFKDISSAPIASFWSDFWKRNSFEKLVALGIAGVMWFFFSFQAETVQRSFTLPITYRNLPNTLFIEESEPREVTVTFASRGQTFERADERSFAIAVHAADFAEGNNIIILTEQEIGHPAGFSVVEIVPLQIKVTVTEFRSFTVPIQAVVEGAPDTGFVVDNITVTPEKIGVLIPERVHVPEFIETKLLDIAGLTENKTFTTQLLLPPQMRFKDRINPEVSVRVTVKKKQ